MTAKMEAGQRLPGMLPTTALVVALIGASRPTSTIVVQAHAAGKEPGLLLLMTGERLQLMCWVMNAGDHLELSEFSLFRYERGGYGGRSGWGDDSREEEDWSKPTAPNERLEQ